MTERVAYVNGDFVPESRAVVTIFDRGLRWGDAVYDVERTFGHEVFALGLHMERLYRTLRYTRIRPPLPLAAMTEVVRELVRRNASSYASDEDFGVCQIVTRGTIQEPERPNFLMYCQDIDWQKNATHYDRGVRLRTSSTRRVPAQALSPNAKTSNKMSQMVAVEEVRDAEAEALPLMLDIYGNVAETDAHNFFFVAKNVLHTPSLQNCLPGISRAVTMEVARDAGIPVTEGAYSVFDVVNSDEAFVTSTSPCLFGVTHLDGLRIGTAFPGPILKRLFEGWKKRAGLDFVAQAHARAAVTA